MELNIPHCNNQANLAELFLFAASSFLGIGQFARLLPSVEVVAVSQAPSPESNPNPPLPSTPWQSTTRPSLADRAVVHRKTPIRSAFARNELSQHYWFVSLVKGDGFNFIHSQGATLPYAPEGTHGVDGDYAFDSCISFAFRRSYPILRKPQDICGRLRLM